MQTWLLVAFIAPFLWALVVLLDVYFTQKAYSEAAEGTIISAFYQGIVLLAIPFVGYSWPSSGWFFFIAGACFIWSCHWYFQSLMIGGDGAMAQIAWNLSTLLVPLFAWGISGESLASIHYLGILFAFFGGTMLALDKEILNRNFSRIVWNMAPAVVGLSLSMTFQKRAFDESPDFFQGFLTYSMGIVVGGIIVLFFHPKAKDVVFRVVRLSRRYWRTFLLGESLSVLALGCSSFAIKIAPAVSFVAVIESLVPAFVMVLSMVFARIYFVTKHPDYQKICEEQVAGFKGKFGAIVMIAVGIYFIT